MIIAGRKAVALMTCWKLDLIALSTSAGFIVGVAAAAVLKLAFRA